MKKINLIHFIVVFFTIIGIASCNPSGESTGSSGSTTNENSSNSAKDNSAIPFQQSKKENNSNNKKEQQNENAKNNNRNKVDANLEPELFSYITADDDMYGANIKDQVNAERAMTIDHALFGYNGVNGNAIHIMKSSAKVEVNYDGFSPVNGFTIAFWCQSEDYIENVTSRTACWLTKTFLANIYLYEKKLALNFWGAPSIAIQTNIIHQNWNHFVISFDTNDLKVYLNGQQIYTSVGDKDFSKLKDQQPNGVFVIGPSNREIRDYRVDSLMTWTKGLSADEILSLYETQKPDNTVLTDYNNFVTDKNGLPKIEVLRKNIQNQYAVTKMLPSLGVMSKSSNFTLPANADAKSLVKVNENYYVKQNNFILKLDNSGNTLKQYEYSYISETCYNNLISRSVADFTVDSNHNVFSIHNTYTCSSGREYPAVVRYNNDDEQVLKKYAEHIELKQIIANADEIIVLLKDNNTGLYAIDLIGSNKQVQLDNAWQSFELQELTSSDQGKLYLLAKYQNEQLVLSISDYASTSPSFDKVSLGQGVQRFSLIVGKKFYYLIDRVLYIEMYDAQGVRKGRYPLNSLDLDYKIPDAISILGYINPIEE